ncbi:2-succinyl-6-hydroxy-2,4-cyclohexadiene-1-carboxylate synthase [Thalassotalea aquiviva]|uniref:2-succinyl-6-hydroxy-2, 4-cyclohexadiene-1-carboxylate synthase n=1 Tax=Thalassotalea aquiviva TaxID=3242415 RepID=UPI00352A94DD
MILFAQHKAVRGSTKPTLVLLHGFMGDHQDWHSMRLHLSDDIPTLAIDLPGHGNSEAIELDHKLGFKQCNNYLTNTLIKHKIKDYILCGYSLGGRVSLYHSAHIYLPQRRQDGLRLCGLIIESAHVGLENEQQKTMRWQSDLTWAENFEQKTLAEVLAHWYQQPIFASLTATQKQQLINARQHNNAAALAQTLRALSLAKQPMLIHALAQSEFSSYYFYGEKDYIYQGIVQKIKAQYDSLTAVKFNHAGHNIHRESAEAFAHQINQLFDSVFSLSGDKKICITKTP